MPINIISKVLSLLKYIRVYKNGFTTVVKFLNSEFPIKAITKDNREIILNNSSEAIIITEALDCDASWEYGDGILRMSYFGKEIKFTGTYYPSNPAIFNSGVIEVFLYQDYDYLKGGVSVLDVGANIGDSSIWFALNGFREVIALEPYPQLYEFLVENVSQNDFNDVIQCFNKGVGSRHSYLQIDPETFSDPGFDLHESAHGIEIEIVTLKEVIERATGDIIYLKMDCEGCEYDVLLNEDCETLTIFKKIVIEYHYGFKKLEEKLSICGFTVTHSGPRKVHNLNAKNPKMSVGFIYARLNGKKVKV